MSINSVTIDILERLEGKVTECTEEVGRRVGGGGRLLYTVVKAVAGERAPETHWPGNALYTHTEAHFHSNKKNK